jgi:hypothetical protein
LRPRPVRVALSHGRHVVRLYVAAENAPRGNAFWTAPRILRVH